MLEIRQIAHPESWAATYSHTIKLNASLGMYILCLSDSTVDIPEDKGQQRDADPLHHKGVFSNKVVFGNRRQLFQPSCCLGSESIRAKKIVMGHNG